jgi:hypothetical protein
MRWPEPGSGISAHIPMKEIRALRAFLACAGNFRNKLRELAALLNLRHEN